MDDVKVHYNSPKPKQLQAHAYTQGTNIYLASGTEYFDVKDIIKPKITDYSDSRGEWTSTMPSSVCVDPGGAR